MLMKSRKSFSLSISFSLKFENFSQLPFTAHGGGEGGGGQNFQNWRGQKVGKPRFFEKIGRGNLLNRTLCST